MKRFALLLACTLMMASSGCCLFGRGLCGGGCNPCSPYGAGYAPSYGAGFAPAYNSGCPNGACGNGGIQSYPGNYPGAYLPNGTTAGVTYGYPVTAGVDPMPVY